MQEVKENVFILRVNDDMSEGCIDFSEIGNNDWNPSSLFFGWCMVGEYLIKELGADIDGMIELLNCYKDDEFLFDDDNESTSDEDIVN